MTHYVNCLLVEATELTKMLDHWNNFSAGDNTGKLLLSRVVKKITDRLDEISQLENKYFLEESSLSRIYQHVEGNPNQSWGTLSAQRYVHSKEENAKRTEELKKELRSRGYGFIPLEGHWRECQDSNIPYDQCPEDKLVDSVETSFFVPNISREDLVELGAKFDQDGTIYGGPDTKNQAELLGKDGETMVSLGRFKPNTIAQAFSRLKNGKPYVFTDDPKPPRPTTPPSPAPVQNKQSRLSQLQTKLDDKIVNPETQNQILVRTALKYDKNHPARKLAMAHLKKK